MTDKLDRQFARIENAFAYAIRDALQDTAEHAANELRKNTPVDTGKMRDSVESTEITEDNGVLSIEVIYDRSDYPDDYYAPFVETPEGEKPMQRTIEESEKVFLGSLTSGSRKVLDK